MKKTYNKPTIEFIYFEHEDIITTSCGYCCYDDSEHGHGNHYGWGDPQPGHGNDGGHGHNHGGHGHH